MNFQEKCSSSALIPSNLSLISTISMTSSQFGFNIILIATVFSALAIIRVNFICNLLGHRLVNSAKILNLCNPTGQVDCQTLLLRMSAVCGETVRCSTVAATLTSK
jgi:hypothetical protein